MREIVNVHVGQAGVKTGEAFWEIACLELGISADGTLKPNPACADSAPQCFFYNANDKFFPRALFIDTEPDKIESLRKGHYGGIFNPSYLISGKESAANNFARGYYTARAGLLNEALHRVRRMIEQSENFQGFVLWRSVAGGTGSGLTAALLEHLAADYGKKFRLEVGIFPSPNVSSTPVEPYNAVLSTHTTLPTIDCSFAVDNEAVHSLLDAALTRADRQVVDSACLNQLIAQAVSSTTISLRSTSALNVDLSDFHTNLVPFQRLHYSGLSFAPVVGREALALNNQSSLEGLTRDLFSNKASLLSSDFRNGRYISSCLLYRGSAKPRDVQQIIGKIKSLKNVNLANWCPTAFKVGYSDCSPVFPPNSVFGEPPNAVCMIATNTAIRDVFRRMASKFRMMYSKRAFVHWYIGEGMEQSELQDAYDDVDSLQREYQALEKHGERDFLLEH